MSDAQGVAPTPRRTVAPPIVRRSRWLAVPGVALGLIVLIAVVLARPTRTEAAAPPGGNLSDPMQFSVALASPAVVRILTTYNATITVQLCAGVSQTYSDSQLAFTGSGAFISSRGDILTAGHVVSSPRSDLDGGLLTVLAPQIRDDILKFCGGSQFLTAEQVVQYYLEQYYSYQHLDVFTATYETPQSSVWLGTALNGTYTESSIFSAKSYPLTVSAQSSFEKNDVAIAHIDLTDTPSLAIGDSTNVALNEELAIIGYPGNGDANHFSSSSIPPNDFLNQSVNLVSVSSINKKNDNGGGVLQVSGNVEHGDSGGPVINMKGEIVGVVSFGGDSQPDGTSFAQASSSVLPLVRQVSLSTTPGAFQTRWHQAMTAYASSDANHWHTAANDLSALFKDYPQFRGITPFVDYAQEQAKTETEISDNSGITKFLSGTVAIIGAGALVVILLIATLVVMLSRRSDRNRRARIAAQNALIAPEPPVTERVPVMQGAFRGPEPQSMAGPPPSGWQPPAPSYPQSQGSWSPPQPSSGSWQPPQPQTPAQPQPSGGWQPPAQQVVAPSRNTCINGHPMQPNETYCRVCGANRSYS